MFQRIFGTVLAIVVCSGMAATAGAQGTYFAGAQSQAKILSIWGSTDYVIRGTATIDLTPSLTYKSSFGAAIADYSSALGIVSEDADNMQAGDYIWLDSSAFGAVSGLYGGASSGIDLDGVFTITNNSLTESLFVTIEYTNVWSLDLDANDPFGASGIVWLNFHSHGAVDDSGSYNQVYVNEGSSSYSVTVTREFAPGAGGGHGHGVTMHFYQNLSGTATVPEAGSLSLAGLAAAGILSMMLRRKQKA
jgi:hypothetical protein